MSIGQLIKQLISGKDGNVRKMGDLLFGNNTLYSRYSQSVNLTDEQRAAANLQGIGRLRDLREAAALSPALAAALQAYTKAETKVQQKALLDDLVDKWAQTDPNYSVGTRFSAPMLRTANEGVALTPGQEQAMLLAGGVSDEYKEKLHELRTKIAALDAFSGEKSSVIYVQSKEQMESFLKTVRETYGKLTDNVYENLLFQTRLQPYLNKIGLKLENGEFKLDFTDVAALFGEVYARSPEKAFVDLGEFLAYSKISSGDNAFTELSSLMVQYSLDAIHSGTFEQYAEALGKEAMEKLGHKTGTEKDDTLYGNELANFITGGEGNDVLNGGDGKDILHGGLGDDRLYGGNNSADTYVFEKGHGKDVVSEYANCRKSSRCLHNRLRKISLQDLKRRIAVQTAVWLHSVIKINKAAQLLLPMFQTLKRLFLMPHLHQGTDNPLRLTVGLRTGNPGKLLTNPVLVTGYTESMVGRAFVFRTVVGVNALNQVWAGINQVFGQKLGGAVCGFVRQNGGV